MDELTPEIVKELLISDNVFEELESATMSKTVAATVTTIPENPSAIIEALNLSQYSLTHAGSEVIMKWIKIYNTMSNKSKSLEKIMSEYVQVCCNYKEYFLPLPTALEGPRMILDIIGMLDSFTTSSTQNQTTHIVDSTEIEAIEYVGGFTLFKSCKKYAFLNDNIEQLCTTNKRSELFKLMSNHTFLKCPNDEMLDFFKDFYISVYEEIRKPTNEINFANLTQTITQSRAFERFAEYIEITCVIKEADCDKLAKYMIALFVRVLSYTFTKKLFQKLFKSPTYQSKGLRGDLKKKSKAPSTKSK